MVKFLKPIIFACLMLFFGQMANAADDNVIEFNAISKKLSSIENSLNEGTFTIQSVDENANFLYQTSNELETAKRENERQAKIVQKQLDALGEEPTDGTKELDVIAKKRKEFKSELAVLKSHIAEAGILQVKIDELNLLILNSRNQRILGNLVNKQSALFEPQNFIAGMKAFIGFIWDITISPVKWYAELNSSDKSYVLTYLIPAFFILIGAFWLGLILRRFIIKNWGYRPDIDNPRYGQKILAAIAVAIAYGAIPSLIIGGFMIWLIGTKIFTIGFFGLVINSTLFYLLYVIIARAVARVTFAPFNDKWRLIGVTSQKAKGIVQALYLCIVLIGAISLLEHIAIQAQYSQDLFNVLITIACAIKTFAIILLTAKIFADENKPLTEEESCEDDENDEDNQVSTGMKIIFFTSVLAIATFTISLFGYPDLSAFILNRYIVSAILFGLFMIFHKLIFEILKRILLLGFWGKTFRLRRKLLNKINFGLGLILNPLIALFFIFILLNLWGLSGEFIIHVTKKLLFGFKVGGVQISLIAVVLGIIVFFVSLALVKILKNRLTINVFSKLDMDDGIKHSLSSGVSFVGFIISSLLAIIVMGGNLTSLAVIAGALSVGIGFGLQNIINNFVSGIIILFERPFKVGDWVIFNGEEGQIKQINIRSTELETFKKSSVIIPNATLLSSTLTNLTHGNNWTRQAVSVGVAYGTDVNKVTEILLECAKSNKKVLKVPAPYVLFQNFGTSSLDFELRCYSSNIWAGWSIPSELRYEINRRFIEEGIEIPFQQIVVHEGDKVALNTQFYAHRKR